MRTRVGKAVSPIGDALIQYREAFISILLQLISEYLQYL